MGYWRSYGFFVFFPANQPGKSINVWVIKKYGLSEVWVMRASTVQSKCKMLMYLIQPGKRNVILKNSCYHPWDYRQIDSVIYVRCLYKHVRQYFVHVVESDINWLPILFQVHIVITTLRPRLPVS